MDVCYFAECGLKATLHIKINYYLYRVKPHIMKNIILYLLLFTNLLSFSQSEIWGVKKYAGINNGGILYSIDSATNKIEIRHRFRNSHIKSGSEVEVFIDTTINKWIGFSGDMIYKYDPVYGTIETKFHRYNPSGSFYKASNGFLYILNNVN